MILKKEVNEQARKMPALLSEIAAYTGKNYGSVYRWFCTNSPQLLRLDILGIIAPHVGIKDVRKLIEDDADR